MGNKKRIRKKITCIESKKISKMAFSLNLICKAGERSVSSLNGIAKVLFEITTSIRENTIKFDHDYYSNKFNFTNNFENPKFEEFVYSVRAITGLSAQEIINKCLPFRELYWLKIKGLLLVGFSLDEAINEIIEAYRL